ncbi:glutamine--fructose-6-phosphate transaminase (isomerizing) [Alphaproteobacteria bacterium]|nr:glutamine--fructose-6-phosphate transaminase (isomerizing) [Alphaproteobacteria bacterium]
MCGIVGIASNSNCTNGLIEGLKKLAYRGYDSAGLATLVNKEIVKRVALGKIGNLEATIKEKPIEGNIGIAHTRWATHGSPNELNAHPHATNQVAIVHNGIIENYKEIKNILSNKSLIKSETDSEVVAHLITDYLDQGLDYPEIVEKLLIKLKGAFALAVLFTKTNKLLAIKRGSPLAVGYGEENNFIGSDAIGLAPFTKKISYLEDDDWAIIDNKNIHIYHGKNKVEREISITSISRQSIEKGGYKHFMHKEIYEQPTVIGETLKSFIDPEKKIIKINSEILKTDIKKITLIACGTSAFACRIARFWFEEFSNISVNVDIASEYRYRKLLKTEGEVVIFISQSGETRDTLASLEEAKKYGLKTISIVNVLDSSISRLSDENIFTLAGPEIGVASTKAFTTQLLTLLIISILLGKNKNLINNDYESKIIKKLLDLPSLLNDVLEKENELRDIASKIYNAKDVLYIGRGMGHGLALEGALKLKEISYIHAEGYAAGELKHGPIALIDEKVPVIGIIPTNNLFDKTYSNLAEVKARGGKIICITDEAGKKNLEDLSDLIFSIKNCSDYLQTIVSALPAQLLAYHVACFKGTDVDQPRNLAKSVTVE